MDEEEREDTELKERFKDKWSRQPSSILTETLRKDVRYRIAIAGIYMHSIHCRLC